MMRAATLPTAATSVGALLTVALGAGLVARPASGGSEVLIGDDRPSWLQGFTRDWGTNWELHTIPYDELRGGGPDRDGIPAIDFPYFVHVGAARWLAPSEPVISLQIGGAARAYPLSMLMYHEIVNDIVEGVPVAVTYCPLCNAAIVFDRRVDGGVLDFGVSGLLRNSDLVMYDRQTEGLWQQFTGECIAGDLAGARLRPLPSSLVSLGQFASTYPLGAVLAPAPGSRKRYGRNLYLGYDTRQNIPYGTIRPLDPRLPPKTRIVAFTVEDQQSPTASVPVAYPLELVADAGVVNDTVVGRPVVVFHVPGVNSALDAEAVARGRDVGATGVLDPVVEGERLTFVRIDGRFADRETGTLWDVLGRAVSGPLEGQQLAPVVHYDTFWFVWAAFRPDTVLYAGQ